MSNGFDLLMVSITRNIWQFAQNELHFRVKISKRLNCQYKFHQNLFNKSTNFAPYQFFINLNSSIYYNFIVIDNNMD